MALLFNADKILAYATDHTARLPRGRTPTRTFSTSVLETPPVSPERNYITGTHPNFDVFDDPRLNILQDQVTPPPTPPRIPSEGRSPLRRASKRAAAANVKHVHDLLADPNIPGLMNLQTFTFYHAAAVKAIAFAPWQPTLVATSGGSNDRQIHFYHTTSGSALAVINVFAQVTSLV